MVGVRERVSMSNWRRTVRYRVIARSFCCGRPCFYFIVLPFLPMAMARFWLCSQTFKDTVLFVVWYCGAWLLLVIILLWCDARCPCFFCVPCFSPCLRSPLPLCFCTYAQPMDGKGNYAIHIALSACLPVNRSIRPCVVGDWRYCCCCVWRTQKKKGSTYFFLIHSPFPVLPFRLPPPPLGSWMSDM